MGVTATSSVSWEIQGGKWTGRYNDARSAANLRTDPTRSADGQFTVAARGRTACITSVATGKCVRVLEGHTDEVLAASYIQVRVPRLARPGVPAIVKSPRGHIHDLHLPPTKSYRPPPTPLGGTRELSSTGALNTLNMTRSGGLAGFNASGKDFMKPCKSEPFLRSIKPVSAAPQGSPRRNYGNPAILEGAAKLRRKLATSQRPLSPISPKRSGKELTRLPTGNWNFAL